MSKSEELPIGSDVVLSPAAQRSLDLPGVLPLLVVAATWELLLKRVIGLAASATLSGGLGSVFSILLTVGSFAEYLALILALVIISSSLLSMIRKPDFGPLPHRITVMGFGGTLVLIGAVGAFITLSPDTGLLAHAATVLLSMLLILGLSWHPIRRRLLIGAVLFLLPTLLRFYASCAISIPMLRTSQLFPLHAFHAAEVAAILAAFAAPWLMTNQSIKDFVRRPPLLPIGLASLPMLTLIAVLSTHEQQLRLLTVHTLGFELILYPAAVIYPLALFSFLLAIALLIIPSAEAQRTLAEQRIGYGLVCLFIAGLDSLGGTMLRFGADPAEGPALVRYFLEGNWALLPLEQQERVGPPLRSIYQLVILGLGYILLARGVYGHARPQPEMERSDGEST